MKRALYVNGRGLLTLLIVLGCLGLYGSVAVAKPLHQEDDDEVHLTIIHMNDVYEIMPVSGGTLGGVARVATLKQQLLAENPDTILTVSGDVHGPSGLGLAVVDGEPLAGKQNIAALNKIGIDYFTFGDHEFDIYTGAQHLARLAETEFPMISSNVFAGENTPFPGVQVNDIFTITNGTGKAMRVGVFGVTEPIPRSAVPISYTNHISATAEQVAVLDPQVDVLIAMTHFGVAEDQDTAQRFPAIDLILGGDDHEHMQVEVGEGLATIFKADSNARSVQVIDLYYNVVSDTVRIESRLQPITDAIAGDPTTQTEVDKWAKIGFDGFREQGIEPTEVVAIPTIDLDGFANTIRNGPTTFTRLMVNGINATASEPELSLMFSALIRMDDVIPAGGDFTMYDVIRTFPNNFEIVSVTIPGAALKGILTFGKQSAGSGQFILYTDNVTQDNDGNWLVDGAAIDDAHLYRAGTTAELAAGFAQFGVTITETHDLNLQELLIQQLRVVFPFVSYLPYISSEGAVRE
ncbi:MAG: hypothetical protein KDE19_11765 [Caldilineaceae bacterium]|nr:hypothetical protein [Caldilineaceae bacterium]